MKVVKWIAMAVAVAGFILALGTAGASDVGIICFDTIIFRVFIALAMMVGGVAVAYFIEKKEYEE